MDVGSYGEIIFEVSTEKIRTWNKLQKKVNARYVKHEVLKQKEVLEFTGSSISTINIDITLNASLNINPEEDIRILTKMLNQGVSYNLILGGNSYGKYALENIEEKWRVTNNKGGVLIADLSLTLLEDVKGS